MCDMCQHVSLEMSHGESVVPMYLLKANTPFAQSARRHRLLGLDCDMCGPLDLRKWVDTRWRLLWRL